MGIMPTILYDRSMQEYATTNNCQSNVNRNVVSFLETFWKLWQETNVVVASLCYTRPSLCDLQTREF
jgi:hypothetical protein